MSVIDADYVICRTIAAEAARIIQMVYLHSREINRVIARVAKA